MQCYDTPYEPVIEFGGVGLAMPINRLFKGSGLKPEEVERFNRAYTYALRSLRLVDRNDPIVDIIAKKIIEVGATGISDPEGSMEAAGGADKPGFKIGEPNFARPLITTDLDGMRAVIVRATDQQSVDAGGAQFGEGDFLRSGLHGSTLRRSGWE